MKSFIQTLLLCSLFSAACQASTMEMREGIVVFEKGQYFIQTSDGREKLRGMDLNSLRKFEGKQVKIAGEDKQPGLDIYKIFVKEKGGYSTSYDWDVVNQDLYTD